VTHPLRANIYLPLLILIFILSEFIVRPIGNYPLNDDWSYSHSVKVYLDTGKLDLGYWPAMTLIAHIWSGVLSCKIFGFSHVVLRLSTLLIALLSAIAFYKLIFRITESKQAAFLLSAFLIFNPLMFSLSNTFMTDVPFVFSVILCFYTCERYLTTRNIGWLLALTLSCIYSILIRQYGLAIVFALFFLMLFVKGRSRFLILIPLILSALAYWQADLFIKSSKSAVTVVTISSVLNRVNVEMLLGSGTRIAYMIAYSGLFLLPLLAPAAVYLFKKQTRLNLRFVIPIFVLLSWGIIYFVKTMPLGNVLSNTALGTETFFETLVLGHNMKHVHSPLFGKLVWWLSIAGSLCFSFIVAAVLVALPMKLKTRKLTDPFRLFTFFFLFFIIIFICITESFFDRYWLPLLPPILVLLAYKHESIKRTLALSAVFIISTGLFSVLATKDYFMWNKCKWQLINRVTNAGTDPRHVNGGFEYLAFNFYDEDWWGYLNDQNHPFYVGFEKRKGYAVMDYRVYQRYIPWKKDTLFLIVNKTESK
jgi:4-amino-4-deoxy-L-arabinose transferase-like glycosyltransferase